MEKTSQKRHIFPIFFAKLNFSYIIFPHYPHTFPQKWLLLMSKQHVIQHLLTLFHRLLTLFLNCCAFSHNFSTFSTELSTFAKKTYFLKYYNILYMYIQVIFCINFSQVFHTVYIFPQFCRKYPWCRCSLSNPCPKFKLFAALRRERSFL